ncbi:hypothetical protein CFC21_065622, partial [Triticum aestivum]|jgi:hypothetical protein
MAAA